MDPDAHRTRAGSGDADAQQLLARLRDRSQTMPVVEQAKGIIIAKTGRPESEAFDILRQVSQQRNVPVRDLAAWLVASTGGNARPRPGQPAQVSRHAQGPQSEAAPPAVPGGSGDPFTGLGMAAVRAGAARGHLGHFHEAGFYGTDVQFAALIVPFVEEGAAAGEPVILGYDDRKTGLLRSWLADPAAVTFLSGERLYTTPARAIACYRRLFQYHVAMGAAQIRIAGDVPHPGNGGRFDGWDRYEWATNTVWQEFPVWGRCLYDTRTTPPAVADAVKRTHPYLVSRPGSAGTASATRTRRPLTPYHPLLIRWKPPPPWLS